VARWPRLALQTTCGERRSRLRHATDWETTDANEALGIAAILPLLAVGKAVRADDIRNAV
jgi:hypothetical protein